MVNYYFSNEIYHHGVKGMKWGVRKYRKNYYGSYTKKGLKRFDESLKNYESKDKIYRDKKKHAGKLKVTYTENNGKKQTYSPAGNKNPEFEKAYLQVNKDKGLIKDYKISKGPTKQDVQKAKMDRKEAKYRLKADYKHLKQDKLADKGKMIYSSGKTISGSKAVTNVLGTIGTTALAAAYAMRKSGKRISVPIGKNRVRLIKPSTIIAGIGAGITTAAIGKKIYDHNQNRKLRAYYGHTSNYR